MSPLGQDIATLAYASSFLDGRRGISPGVRTVQLAFRWNRYMEQLTLVKSTSYKAKCLKAIDDSVGKKSITIKIAQIGLPFQIEDEEQLDDYLNKLKEKLFGELKGGNTIIIE